MSDMIKANTSWMQSNAEDLRDCVNRISNQYGDLVQRKQELDSMWDGEAGDTFRKEFEEDLAALKAMIDNLQKVYSFEDMARGAYQSCENQISGMISDL